MSIDFIFLISMTQIILFLNSLFVYVLNKYFCKRDIENIKNYIT